ncbi:MAG: AMP-binding protein, partial [Gammaproteobacteria bacterium]|nr:AMP-binding protein [Gammaproteobacteria bacterium]
MSDYKTAFRRSLAHPEEYWAEQAASVAWYKSPGSVLGKDTNGNDAWFSDGELNSSYLALDYHIEQGRGDQTALIYDSPVTNSTASYTYSELRDEVATFAGVLASLSISQGDRVIIYMPMIPQAVIAMLACARLGAIHSVVFGGFAAKELATRIDDATPKAILCASCGIEFSNVIAYKPLIDEALQISEHKIDHCLVYQRQESVAEMANPWDKDWDSLLAVASPVDPVSLPSSHPLYILYTSGTTGKPKGVVRDNGGHAVALTYSMKNLYNLAAGEVFWAASDVGWVVGHSYIVYGPLFAGCTTILFEGKPVRTPDAGTFWRILSDYKVNVFFTAPTAFRAIRKEDPEASLLSEYDLSHLRSLFVAGERTDPSTYEWLCEILGVPV